MQLIDPIPGGGPYRARGYRSGLILSQPELGEVITPDDNVVYDPPIMVWVGDPGAVTVAVAPYGREGDKTVSYPATFNVTLPVLCRQVFSTGTTATALRTGSALPTGHIGTSGGPPPLTADTTSTTADTTTITADRF